MIDLRSVLGEIEPEQSILLTYALGLTELDHALLPLLQNHGEGRVTVLCDPGGIEAAFAERATTYGPGVRYRLLPYQPPSGLSFHPKLYLVAGRAGARLVVTSANLTLYGFRQNLEIVDVATLGPDQRKESHLFANALEFMARLGELDETVGGLLEPDLKAMRRRLRPWMGDMPPDAVGELLHSLDRPLMDQVAAMVPAEEIQRILCVSPFFDKKGSMLRELCARYPLADVDLVGPGEGWTDLSGECLADLSDRIHPQRLIGVDGASRRLHGKLLAFRGRERSWTIAGSANATRAAWLGTASAHRSGNVEVVIVREHQDTALIDELRDSLKVTPVELASLKLDNGRLEDDRSPGVGLAAIHAEQEGPDRIGVIARVRGVPATSVEFHVRVEGRVTTVEADATVTGEAGAGTVHLAAPLNLSAFEDDLGPLVLWVEGVQDGQRIVAGRTWMERPGLLNLTSRERRIQSAIARTRLSRSMGENEVQDITDALSRFVSEIGQPAPLEKGGAPSASAGSGASDRAKEVARDMVDPDPEDFTLPRDGMHLHRVGSPSSQVLRILQQVGEALREQFEGAPVEDPDMADDGEAGMGLSAPRGASRFPPLQASVHRAVQSKVSRPLIERLRTDRDRLRPIDVLHVARPLSWLLLSLAASEQRRVASEQAQYLESDGGDDASRRETQRNVKQAAGDLVDLMELLFSIDGLLRGSPVGLFIKTWMGGPERVDETLPPEDAEGFLLATSVALRLLPRREGSLDLIAGGLRLLLADRDDWDGVEAAASRLEPRAREIAKAFDDAFTAEDLLALIHKAGHSTAESLQLAEWWAPVYFLARQDGNPPALNHAREVVEASESGRSILSLLDRLVARGDLRPIAVADLDAGSEICGRCRVGIPVGHHARLRDVRHPYVHCESCGGLIAPLDDPATEPTRRFVRALRHLVLEA